MLSIIFARSPGYVSVTLCHAHAASLTLAFVTLVTARLQPTQRGCVQGLVPHGYRHAAAVHHAQHCIMASD